MASNQTGMIALVGARTRVFVRALMTHGRIPIRYWTRGGLVLLVVLVGLPFRWYEHLVLSRKIKKQTIKPPVFILGHWRSGTTHLHNLMTINPDFGYVSYLQGLFPLSFASNPFFGRFMEWIMPERRPMDNMKMSIKATQEEELPMAAIAGCGNFMGWYFPEHMWAHYDKWVRFNATDRELRRWERTYIGLLKTATYVMGGKRLVLKNPPNTRRIQKLLELFPDAKFIHIYRDPVRIYASSMNMYKKALPFFQMQDFDMKNVQKNVLRIYKDMMQHYLDTRDLIPDGQLVEVAFETLEKSTLPELKRIYDKLNLPGYHETEPSIMAYLESKRAYKKNVLQTDADVRAMVEEEWTFAFRAFGYERTTADPATS